MRTCDWCGRFYNPLRVLRDRNGDYPLTQFCSGTCQARAGVLSVRDLLVAERRLALTDNELEAILSRIGPMREAVQ